MELEHHGGHFLLKKSNVTLESFKKNQEKNLGVDNYEIY
jgi:hypothetical protein